MSVEQTVEQISSRHTSHKRLTLRNCYDLLLLAGLALLLPLLVLLPIPLLRVPLGLAMVLLAPGYALTAAVFAHRDDLDGAAQLAISFGLSIAVIPVLALVLDQLPWGIRLWSMVISLSVWIVAVCGIAAARRYALGPADAVTLPGLPRVDPGSWWRRVPPAHRVGYALGVIAALGMLIWGVLVFSSDPEVRTTEFYALGADGLAENYPREVAPGEEMQVQLGIINGEGAPMRYRVDVRSGAERLAEVGPITVADETTWEQPIRYALATPGDDQIVDILLFRQDESTPYRQLRLWVNVRER